MAPIISTPHARVRHFLEQNMLRKQGARFNKGFGKKIRNVNKDV